MMQFHQRSQQVSTQYNAGQNIYFNQLPLSLTERQLKYQRARMLERVQTYWIEDVLKPSIHKATHISLRLQKITSATVSPLEDMRQEFDQSRTSLPSDVSIEQIYDQANGEVLILGEPGSGKTTQLLKLTSTLLERARQDESLPIPVLFPLSSWANPRQPLEDWLVAKLIEIYDISFPLATSWIKNDQILPLLDGLDEMAAIDRVACVEAINAYRQRYGLLPTVVCSRQQAYLELFPTRLHLHTAIVVEPLTPQQIETYLTKAGEPLAALHRRLNEDTDLQDLARTPLMLDVLAATYWGASSQEMTPTSSPASMQEHLFALYVQRMLRRRRATTPVERRQTISWLAWLAKQMSQHHSPVFYIEQLHPHWLPENWMLRVYNRLAIWLPGVLMGMFLSLAICPYFFSTDYNYSPLLLIQPALIGGFLGSLLSRGRTVQQPLMSEEKPKGILWYQLLQWLVVSTLIGFFSGVSNTLGFNTSWKYGLITGLGIGASCLLLQMFLEKNTTRSPPRTPCSIWRRPWQCLTRSTAVRNGLLVGLMMGLTNMVSHMLATDVEGNVFPWGGVHNGLTAGLTCGLCFGIVGALLSVLLTRSGMAIQPTDRLTWSWRRLRRGLFSKSFTSVAISLAAFIGLLRLLVLSLFPQEEVLDRAGWIGEIMGGMLSLGLAYWFLLGLFQAVSSETMEDQHRRIPNQGIHRSAFNGFVLGLSSAIIIGVIYVLGRYLGFHLGFLVGYIFTDLSHVRNYLIDVLSNVPSDLVDYLSQKWIILLSIILSTGLLVALLNGGLACIRHYLLRFLFWRYGLLPWKLAPFLDVVEDRLLLLKVGGGYVFRHRLLLDYFAALETKPISDQEA